MSYLNPLSRISILISGFAIFLLIIHLIFPTIVIDAIAITLFLIAIIPWAGQIFRSIKLPGGFQIDYRELKELSQDLKATGLTAEPTKEPPNYELTTIQSLSPTLQLVNLRIEIEKRIRHLAELCEVVENRRSLDQVVIGLVRADALSLGDLEVLRQLFRILNPAIHGEEIADPVFYWALEEGPHLLAGLDLRIERKLAGKPAL